MTTVNDVMTREVVTIRPSASLRDVARTLIQCGISGAPVVDDEGVVVGVVSEADILIKEQGEEVIPHRPLERVIGPSASTRSLLAKSQATSAGGAMTKPAITISPSASVAEAARVMTEHRVNRLPVVTDGRLVGIVSRADLVRTFVRTDEELVAALRDEVLWTAMRLNPVAFDITVDEGRARIKGHVERRSEAELIASIAALVPGIVQLRTDITWHLDDQEIRPLEVDLLSPYTFR